MHSFSPEAAPPEINESAEDVVARFLTEHIEPMREQQAQLDTARPDPLPKTSHLLAEALAARRISVKKVVDGRWVFEFAGSTIGGYALTDPAGGVTTLVSAHARRVLRDAAKVRTHLDLMEIPHPLVLPEPQEADATPPLFDLNVLAPKPRGSVLQVRAYTVGREAVSVLVFAPDSSGQRISVDVTDVVAEGLRTLAVDAMRAIPGLLCAAVSLEAYSLDSADKATVVGIDETASIVPHHFPQLGRGRPVADAIAEQILSTAAI